MTNPILKYFRSDNPVAFYFLVAGVFLILTGPFLLSEGMFMDGLIYSSIARNLSEGIGTFWNPHFTSTCMPSFHEHPPLAFWLQSLMFQLTGDTLLTDKLYSLLTVLASAFLIVRIWKFLVKDTAWLPLLLWVVMPLTTWSAPNNMLENTLTVFTLLSVWFWLKSTHSHTLWFLLLSGISLSLGFMTKGFVAFFPLTMPFLYGWLVSKNKVSVRLYHTLIQSAAALIPLFLMIVLWDAAGNSIGAYINTQVIHSLTNVETVASRFFIIGKMFSELLPAAGLGLLFFLVTGRKKSFLSAFQTHKRTAVFFLFTALCGVLPIMISMKQNGFYIVPSLPLFAIGLALFFYPAAKKLIGMLASRSFARNVFVIFSLLILLAGITLSLAGIGKAGRDNQKIEDTKSILTVVPQNATISIAPALRADWTLHGYFMRYGHVSLDAYQELKYFVAPAGFRCDSAFTARYHRHSLLLSNHFLYENTATDL